MKKTTKYVYVKESLIQSILADIVSFGSFFILLTINYKVWEGERIVTIFLLILWLLFGASKVGILGERKVFLSDDQLRDYLEKKRRKLN
jgi:hypothetical protein